ncbi:K(+)-transporting ATPase subunit F [bacterium]|nr:K(+)-transporting ATPase subunit F [bacterium]
MAFDWILAGAIAALLAGYLTYAAMNPERF